MLDSETDTRLVADTHDTLTSMLQTLAEENVGHWLQLCKSVLTAAGKLINVFLLMKSVNLSMYTNILCHFIIILNVKFYCFFGPISGDILHAFFKAFFLTFYFRPLFMFVCIYVCLKFSQQPLNRFEYNFLYYNCIILGKILS